MATVQERLNIASPIDIADRFRQLPVGDIMAGQIPTLVSRSGLASSATQVHSSAGQILTASNGGGTALGIVNPDVTVGATTVVVAYDANGLATLTFNAAVTAYDVTMLAMPAGLGATLASVA